MTHVKKCLWVGAITVLALTTAGGGLAQTGPRTPPPPAGQSPAQPAAPTPGRLDHASLGQMLRMMGHQPEERTPSNGTPDYLLKVTRGEWDVTVRLAFSSNKRVLWINTNLANVPAGGIPAAVVQTLLAKNGTVVGKAFFRVGSNQLLLSQCVDNRDVTAAELRQELHDFIESVAATETEWNPKRWTTTAAQPTQPAPPGGN